MSDLHRMIADANGAFMAAFADRDAKAMAALYTAQGQLQPPGSDFVDGKDAIEAFWSAVIDMGIASARLETVEIDDQGDTAIEIGKYTLGTADGNVADEGKYLVVWKRRDGAWRLHRDIWNTSRG